MAGAEGWKTTLKEFQELRRNAKDLYKALKRNPY
jgi:hypothetical protein